MAVEILKENTEVKWAEVVLGATKSRAAPAAIPLLSVENRLCLSCIGREVPHRPVVAMEILDMVPRRLASLF